MILTVTLNAAIDKRYVVENFRLGEVNRVHTLRAEKDSMFQNLQQSQEKK